MVKSKTIDTIVQDTNKIPQLNTIQSIGSTSAEPTPIRTRKAHTIITPRATDVENTSASKTESKIESKIDSDNVTTKDSNVDTTSSSQPTNESLVENKHDKFVNVPKTKIEATVSIEDAVEQSMSRSKAVRDMNADTSVVIDNKETYFERLVRNQDREDANKPSYKEEFHANMSSEIIEDDTNLSDRFLTKKTNDKYDTIIVPTEQLKQPSEIEKGMCQYYVTALYILDSVNRKKYLQGTIITLPADVDKMPKIFKTCFVGGRLIKCEDISKKVNRQKQMYDSRTRRWVKEGTPEYEAYKKYMDEKQAKITEANERKIAQERKRLGID